MLSLALCWTIAAVTAEPQLAIQPQSDPARVSVIAMLPDRLDDVLPAGNVASTAAERWLRLRLVDEQTGQFGEPILARYQRDGNRLTLTPRYPLSAGQKYRAEWTQPDGTVRTAEYRVPARSATTPTVVEAIYPSAAQLPANLLKFYIHFSQPMREGHEIFDRIRLVDDRGVAIESPWRNTELWSADARRLTLWIHPGRVKAGVNLREEQGPVLEPGRRYTLVIGGDLLDAAGQPLGKPFHKSFQTLAEDHARLQPDKWRLDPPAADSQQPLRLEFPEPLDRHLLVRYLNVTDSNGNAVAGTIEIGRDERSWSFTPEQAWRAEAYTLVIGETLEDLAGNTPARVFDTDLTAAVGEAPTLRRSFQPQPLTEAPAK